MMATEELNERATSRAIAERLHTFKIAGQSVYMVRSRQTEPGSMHQVHVTAGTVDHCSCQGWYYRQSCTHAAAVTRRLEREHRNVVAARIEMPVESHTRRDNIYADES